MGKPQGKAAVYFPSYGTAPFITSQDLLINKGKGRKRVHINHSWKVIIFHCTYVRSIKHPASSTKTYPSHEEPVVLVQRHSVINVFNYKITTNARINVPSLSKHLFSSWNPMLRMFWLRSGLQGAVYNTSAGASFLCSFLLRFHKKKGFCLVIDSKCCKIMHFFVTGWFCFVHWKRVTYFHCKNVCSLELSKCRHIWVQIHAPIFINVCIRLQSYRYSQHRLIKEKLLDQCDQLGINELRWNY